MLVPYVVDFYFNSFFCPLEFVFILFDMVVPVHWRDCFGFPYLSIVFALSKLFPDLW